MRAHLGTGATSTAGGTVAVGAGRTVTFRVKVDADVVDDVDVVNVAGADFTGAQTGLGLSSTSNAVDDPVAAPRADLRLTKVADPDLVQRGDAAAYTVTVVNDGPKTADGRRRDRHTPGRRDRDRDQLDQGDLHDAGAIVCTARSVAWRSATTSSSPSADTGPARRARGRHRDGRPRADRPERGQQHRPRARSRSTARRSPSPDAATTPRTPASPSTCWATTATPTATRSRWPRRRWSRPAHGTVDGRPGRHADLHPGRRLRRHGHDHLLDHRRPRRHRHRHAHGHGRRTRRPWRTTDEATHRRRATPVRVDVLGQRHRPERRGTPRSSSPTSGTRRRTAPLTVDPDGDADLHPGDRLRGHRHLHLHRSPTAPAAPTPRPSR